MRDLYTLLSGENDFFSKVKHTNKTFAEHENIINQGASTNAFFMIRKGKVRVRLQSQNEPDQKLSIIDLEAGDTFGEMSLFNPSPASASVISVTTTEILEIDIASLKEYMEKYPEVGYKILKILIQNIFDRLRHSNKVISQLINWKAG